MTGHHRSLRYTAAMLISRVEQSRRLGYYCDYATRDASMRTRERVNESSRAKNAQTGLSKSSKSGLRGWNHG
jgi:hypothetical protein